MKYLDLYTNSGLMLALDMEDALEAEAIIADHREFIDAIKLGSTILVSPRGGMGFISRVYKEYDLPVLIDAKLKDVLHVLLSTIRSYRAHGAAAVTCWADVGRETIQFLITNLSNDLDIVVLTALTSLHLKDIEQSAKDNILMAVEVGCRFIQIPGNYPELISWARRKIPSEVKIISCGIGRQGGQIGDAIRCGADYEIIGRYILDSDDMRSAFRDCAGVIRQRVSERCVS